MALPIFFNCLEKLKQSGTPRFSTTQNMQITNLSNFLILTCEVCALKRSEFESSISSKLTQLIAMDGFTDQNTIL